jgi:polyisoprenoid-binding protein YceI
VLVSRSDSRRSNVTGPATVRGVERPLTFAVQARMDGDTLDILGTTDFTWADFEIPPPNIGGIVQVEDNVHIEVLIVAKREA